MIKNTIQPVGISPTSPNLQSKTNILKQYILLSVKGFSSGSTTLLQKNWQQNHLWKEFIELLNIREGNRKIFIHIYFTSQDKLIQACSYTKWLQFSCRQKKILVILHFDRQIVEKLSVFSSRMQMKNLGYDGL